MKVLLIAENWPPRIGGIEKYLTGLTTELSKQHEVTVIAPSAQHEKAGSNEQGLKVIRKRFFWPLIKPTWLPLYIFVHRLAQKEQFDVVLCGKGLFEGLVGYYLNKRLDIPYVVFTYAMEIEEWNKHLGTRRKLQRVLGNAKTIVAINEVTKKRLVELTNNAEKIVTIYPAVDTTFINHLTQVNQEPLQRYGVTKPYILCVSRLIPRKGIDDLIRAYAKLDQTKLGDTALVIVGDGPQRAELESIAAREYVQPYFLGVVPDEDLPALYANAELLALTPKEIESDIEGFGIVYLEAGAAGIPVIGTKTGGVPEAVADKTTGLLVSPGDIGGIAKVMTELLTNPDLRRRLGDAGKKRVQDMFTWSISASSLHQTLESLRDKSEKYEHRA